MTKEQFDELKENKMITKAQLEFLNTELRNKLAHLQAENEDLKSAVGEWKIIADKQGNIIQKVIAWFDEHKPEIDLKQFGIHRGKNGIK